MTALKVRHQRVEEGLRDGSEDFSLQNTNLLPADLPIHGILRYRSVA